MARGRIISPEFWTDSAIVRLSPFARLLYIGMWNHAYCDRGHLNDDAWDLKLKVLPADQVDPEALLAELTDAGRVLREQASGGRTFLSIPTFRNHQKADDPRYTRKCPFCTENATEHGSARPSAPEHDNSQRGGGLEGTGEGLEGGGSTRGARPPRYCSNHPTGTTSGCLACKDARINQQEWDTARKAAPNLRRPRPGDHACIDDGNGWCSKCGEKVA